MLAVTRLDCVRVHKLGHNVVAGAHPEESAPVKVLPDSAHASLTHQQSGQTLGRGMDFALVVLVFLGIGYGLDRWLDTRRLFMIGLVVFAWSASSSRCTSSTRADDERRTKPSACAGVPEPARGHDSRDAAGMSDAARR